MQGESSESKFVSSGLAGCLGDIIGYGTLIVISSLSILQLKECGCISDSERKKYHYNPPPVPEYYYRKPKAEQFYIPDIDMKAIEKATENLPEVPESGSTVDYQEISTP